VKQPIYLGVNVDHVAALRQGRGSTYPDPVHAGLQAELAGADSITMHLRTDRRHTQVHDVERFAASGQTKLNLEISATKQMVDIAVKIKPQNVCFVPENRQELDAMGGVNVLAHGDELADHVAALQEASIQPSILIDAEEQQVEASARLGAPCIQLHTGAYSDATTHIDASNERQRIMSSSDYAFSLGLMVNAGHGLHYDNVQSIAEIETINELRIGHSLITRALYWGLPTAVSKMKRLMVEARHR